MTFAAVCGAILLAAAGHAFLWAAVINRLHGLAGPRWAIKLATAACVLAAAAIPLFLVRDAWLDRAEAFNPLVGDHWTGWYARACAAIGAASLAAKTWIEARRYDRSVLLNWDAELLAVANPDAPHAWLHGAWAQCLGRLPGNEALAVSIDRKRLAIPRLPAELSGLTIAHMSDLHMSGRVGREYFESLVHTVNGLRPDVVAITGDIVESEECWPWLQSTLAHLVAPLGVYFILGNHDKLVDAGRTQAILSDCGLTNVGGRWLRADWNGAAVQMAGNELPWLPAASLKRQPSRAVGPGVFRLVLCHTPDQFSWCCEADADLALAGHTHGGQVQLPLLGSIACPSLHGTRFACGVFRRGPTVLHVTRGVSGKTPLRWRCPPEIALLELVRGGPSD